MRTQPWPNYHLLIVIIDNQFKSIIGLSLGFRQD